MRTIFFILRKEFRQIFRHRVMLPMIFLMPIVQLLILSNAADFEVRNIYLHVVDRDLSPASRRLIGQFAASKYFVLTQTSFSAELGLRDLEANDADLVLEIPADFEKKLLRENEASLHLNVNAINATKAGLGQAYASAIIRDFNNNLRMEWLDMPDRQNPGRFDITHSFWFNPDLNYKAFMVPGILVMLVTLVGLFLAGINVVKEKEIGTIEQINVTPIRKYHFILAKLIPFWVIGMFVFTLGLLGVARLVYGIVPVGSLLTLYAFLAVYLVAMLGVGLIISTYSATQQQSMSLAFFFMMIFILMGGLFTPVDSMPEWAQWIARANPVAYFIEVVRLVVLKGSSFYDIRGHFLVITGMAVFFNVWAVWNYRKTS